MSLANKTITGFLWNFGEQLARRGLGVLITLLLASFLSPEDYALIAMMAVFIALGSSLMDSGFKAALIRLQDATREDFNTAFIANIALGLVSYGLLFFAAPFIAVFYNEPSLVFLVRVVSLTIIINSFQMVQMAQLSKALNFKAQMRANLPAAIFSGMTAVAMAYKGFGVWALVFQMLVSSVLTVTFLWMQTAWRPSWNFSFLSLKTMYLFGYKLFLSGALDIVFKNLYVVIIAKLFSAKIAGWYFFADKIKELLVSQLVGAISTVTYPALVSFQEDDSKLKDAYRKVLMVMTFILFPIFAFIAALAEPIFIALLPEKWHPAALYLQLMLCGAMLLPLHVVNLNVLKVKGRSDLFLLLEVIKKVLVCVIVFIAFKYGVIGILLGQIANSFLAYIPNSYFSAKLIDYKTCEQIADVMPAFLLSVVLAVMVYKVQLNMELNIFLEIGLLSVVAGFSYLIICHVFKLKAYVLLQQMVLNKLSRDKNA